MKATAHDRRGVSNVARGRQVLRSKAGQALTEFSLLLPVLALIFIGVLDLGRAFHTQVAASNAARVGLLFAQQVASPRMLDCSPGTTCQFITVGDIISTTQNEAQGGIDASQMQVGVCLQHVSTCPITDTSIAVASDEPITVSVTVPFTTITPFVHLKSIGGAVSGRTFAFEPVAPTDTPGATATPSPTATPGPTATPAPTATLEPTPAIGGAFLPPPPGTRVTITWQILNSTDANNEAVVWVNGAWHTYPASAGTTASVTFNSTSSGTCTGSCYFGLGSGTYYYYVHSWTSGGSNYQPSWGAGCKFNTGAIGCFTFTLY